MNSAPHIELLILAIEDIRETANECHDEVIDLILVEARKAHKQAQQHDITANEYDLTVAVKVKALVEVLEQKFKVLTGRG